MQIRLATHRNSVHKFWFCKLGLAATCHRGVRYFFLNFYNFVLQRCPVLFLTTSRSLAPGLFAIIFPRNTKPVLFSGGNERRLTLASTRISLLPIPTYGYSFLSADITSVCNFCSLRVKVTSMSLEGASFLEKSTCTPIKSPRHALEPRDKGVGVISFSF